MDRQLSAGGSPGMKMFGVRDSFKLLEGGTGCAGETGGNQGAAKSMRKSMLYFGPKT